MPRGSAPGERRGGRAKGTPNKITAETREAFKALFEGLVPDLVGWIRETATGKEVLKLNKDGAEVKLLDGRDPGKAAELVLKLAEFNVPKLNRLTIDLTKLSLEELATELARREAEAKASEK